ncbi:hypothetical protein LEP1GSC073_3380 [Leptospira noguchii str. Cascata]|uniref:Uncharacterized protein n=1 Tax=Leptospira noguchii str. 2001034031 TaxID=1193053 RepID=M6YGJ4_9LEPT|nr:hypothetical protein LEP1GSC072_1437 [Leptospira noguchii str. Bonito]EMO29695.1 hypothetical protein LEP1GSC170_5292 [Leptospira interrogans serovar Bataviae str. HAI135]EMO88754.1 hypothetical protein LEP1GSC024_4886 [Leptospira noguchii str. 2001034031]EMS88142.1 hypothetical protein LEP1GSC073_3380 [Leptospira noguchii str. Cascata]
MDGLVLCGVISTAIALVEEDKTATEGIFFIEGFLLFF